MAETLVHFVARERTPHPSVPEDIKVMSPDERLAAILRQGSINPFPTFTDHPAVCMTECSGAGLEFLIGRRGYRPWGLMFDRQTVFDAGGGPVWYVRDEDMDELATSRLRRWAVRLGENSDWLEEREWRVPRDLVDGSAPSIPLADLGLFGVIVGERNWWCPVPARGVDGTEPPWQEQFDDALQGLQKHWWDPESEQLILLPS
ncbi:hypothetical protein ACWEVD_00990 [Nocardia thailandica]